MLLKNNRGLDFGHGSCIMVYMMTNKDKNMMTNKDKILEDIRLIKKIIEDSTMPLQLQFNCIDAMQRILNNAEVEH
jgi:uncharacterized protein (UPF0147 family)